MSTPDEIPFQQLLDALLDADKPFNPCYLYRLSDLESSELNMLQNIWADIPTWRRKALMEDIEDLSVSDMLLSFISIGKCAASDIEPAVRALAVHTLWSYFDHSLIPLLLNILRTDSDMEVRAAAAGALGQYVFAGEIEELPLETLLPIEELLLSVVENDPQAIVRRAALESLGNSSREEVSPLIEAAYASNDRYWVASALDAMGHSMDPRWSPQVLASMESKLPLVRCAAARAAGELELKEANPLLIELLDDPDDNIRRACIWSLSQIGGPGIGPILEHLYEEAEIEQDIELLEAAIENLAFTEGLAFKPLFDIPDSENDLDDLDLDDDFDFLVDEDFDNDDELLENDEDFIV